MLVLRLESGSHITVASMISSSWDMASVGLRLRRGGDAAARAVRTPVPGPASRAPLM